MPVKTSQGQPTLQHRGNSEEGAECFEGIINEYRKAPAYCRFGALSYRLEGPQVRIFVGKNLKEFRIYEAWLVEKSPFFKALFKENFSEAQSKSATLAEEDPLIFHLFINLLLTGRIGKLISLPGAPQWRAHRFVQLWILADFLAAPEVKAWAFQTIKEIVEPYHGRPFSLEPKTIQLLYSNTIPTSDHLELRWLVCGALKRRLTTWTGFTYSSSLNMRLWRRYNECVEAERDLKVDLAGCECGIQSCIPWESRVILFERAVAAGAGIEELMYLRFEEPCETTIHCLFYWRPWLTGVTSGSQHHWIENEGLMPLTDSDTPISWGAESSEPCTSTCGVNGDEEVGRRSALLNILRG